jgi:hypothetical protein
MFTFIESSLFERICPVYLDDDEYAELQQFMLMLTIYAKAKREDVPAHILKQLLEAFRNG